VENINFEEHKGVDLRGGNRGDNLGDVKQIWEKKSPVFKEKTRRSKGRPPGRGEKIDQSELWRERIK